MSVMTSIQLVGGPGDGLKYEVPTTTLTRPNLKGVVIRWHRGGDDEAAYMLKTDGKAEFMPHVVLFGDADAEFYSGEQP